jgi:hypothetical protein
MINFLYWNLGGRKLEDLACGIVLEHKVNVIILAECALSIPKLLSLINQESETKYISVAGYVDEPIILIDLPTESVGSVGDYRGISVKTLTTPLVASINLFVVHLPSKKHHTPADQSLLVGRLSTLITKIECEQGHRRSILVGDFNMNPFEDGIVNSDGLHAVMSKEVALRRKRTVGGMEKYFFYNPMWSHFGDYPIGPAATYYYAKATPIQHFWNMFDQVIIRPELIGVFKEENLKILTSSRGVSLLNSRGQPDISRSSDHLPVYFSLNI